MNAQNCVFVAFFAIFIVVEFVYCKSVQQPDVATA